MLKYRILLTRVLVDPQVPVKPKPWVGVREAKSPPPDCVQGDKDNPGSVLGDEDCLYLNVFTPLVST